MMQFTKHTFARTYKPSYIQGNRIYETPESYVVEQYYILTERILYNYTIYNTITQLQLVYTYTNTIF